jgi:hypothetical protein
VALPDTVITYPTWTYYPRNARPADWVSPLIETITAAESTIGTVTRKTGLTSDGVLQALAPNLQTVGYRVETGKTAKGKIRRPVLFGENGRPEVSYEIDAFHEEHGVVVEVEAGRGARGNASYRDIIRASLILDARYFVLLLPVAYRHLSGGREIAVQAYREARDQLNAIYASQRLRLPFDGVLLVGY